MVKDKVKGVLYWQPTVGLLTLYVTYICLLNHILIESEQKLTLNPVNISFKI